MDSGRIPYPRYSYPPRLVLAIATSVLLGRKRSLITDAKQFIAAIVPHPQAKNAHLIPRKEPFIVVTNHYHRPGYSVWWGILLITAIIAQVQNSDREIVWLMSNRWTYQHPLPSLLLTPLTYLLFTRIAHTYGLVSTPPMPPQPRYTEEAARAVRRILSLFNPQKNKSQPIIGIAPEGRDSPDGSLLEPSPGTGRFLIHLARCGLRLLPVGVAEIEGVLTASFGPPFVLKTRPNLSKIDQDRYVSTQVMTAIGMQLPEALWGAFGAQIGEALAARSS